jgi:hypothetical protein
MHRSIHNDVKLGPNIHDMPQAWRIELMLGKVFFVLKCEK